MANDDELGPMTPENRERLRKLTQKLGLTPQQVLLRALREYAKKIAEDRRKKFKVHEGGKDD